MRKFITFLLVAATVALSLLTAIMMLSATDIFPLPSDFQESAASIISRIAVVLAEAVLVSGLCVATHFLIKKEKVYLLADRILSAVWLFLTGVCIIFLCVVYKMDFRLTVILTLSDFLPQEQCRLSFFLLLNAKRAGQITRGVIFADRQRGNDATHFCYFSCVGDFSCK